MGLTYGAISEKGSIVRTEHFRDLMKGVIKNIPKEDLDFLNQAHLYFICSRLDVIFDKTKEIKQNGKELVFSLKYTNDNDETTFFTCSFTTGYNVVGFEISKDSRTIELKTIKESIFLNAGLHPVIRQSYPIECLYSEVLYIGFSETKGIKGRYKNGHISYDDILAKEGARRKNRDVFIFGCIFDSYKLVPQLPYSTQSIESVTDEETNIKAIEASLISYFKPEFNDLLKEFPNNKDIEIIKKLKKDKFKYIDVQLYNQVLARSHSGCMYENRLLFYTEHVEKKDVEFFRFFLEI